MYGLATKIDTSENQTRDLRGDFNQVNVIQVEYYYIDIIYV
jgi:hypothetical protein